MTSTSISISREFQLSLPSQKTILDQQLNLLHEQSRHFTNCYFFTGSWTSETTQDTFERVVLIFYSKLDHLDVSPISFSSQTFWGFISLVQILGLGCPVWGTKLLLPQQKTGLVKSLFIVYQRWEFWCFFSMWFFFFIGRSYASSFQIFSEVSDSYVAVDLVCPWEEVISGSSYAALLQKSRVLVVVF